MTRREPALRLVKDARLLRDAELAERETESARNAVEALLRLAIEEIQDAVLGERQTHGNGGEDAA